jgi:D-glycero-D-manno-heptose 1,7-bisphosphate phosphatase
VVATNQSGVARGMYSARDAERLHRLASGDLQKDGVFVSGWYMCPHHPDFTGPCECRKPQPGMLAKAAGDLGLDLCRSYMIGDSPRDAEAGLRAGLRLSVLIREGPEGPAPDLPAGAAAAKSVRGAAELVVRDFLGQGQGQGQGPKP